jgi:hypothetical protein
MTETNRTFSVGFTNLVLRTCRSFYHAESGAAKMRSLWRTRSTADSIYNSTSIVMECPGWIIYAIVGCLSH